MSQGTDTQWPATGYPSCDGPIREGRAWLEERGTLLVGSGRFRTGRLSGSLHTDFGPQGQDKETNQDYALAWWPREESATPLRFALAMGDGLTTSFRSECAAALACWVALRALVEAGPGLASQELARFAFNAAGSALGQLADDLAREPETSCPAGQFPSTWKYMLKRGALFQTTLTLAWLDDDCLRIAMVGDGGAVWRAYDAADPKRQPADRILAHCDLESQQVYALGPADRCVGAFDCWHEEKLSGPFLCAVATDGVGRGLGDDPLALLDELEELEAAGVENPAQRFIEQAAAHRPKNFDDNLTLAAIRGD